MPRPKSSPDEKDWFGARIIRRLDQAIEEWARQRRPPGSARSRPRDLDEILGYSRDWWPEIRSGRRRATSGLNLGQIQAMCEAMGIEATEIVGRPSPLVALRELSAGAERPRKRRHESLLDAAFRLRGAGDFAGAAKLLVRALDEPSPEAWVRASYLFGSVARIDDAVSAATEGLLLSILEADRRGEARSLMAIGNAYGTSGSYLESEAAYGAALRHKEDLEPVDLWAAFLGHGRALRLLGRMSEAVGALRLSMEYAGTPGRRCFLWWLIGDIERERERPDSAFVAYERAIELGEGARPEVSAVDRAHLLTLMGSSAYAAGRDDVARRLMPASLVLLSELARISPEAEAILAGAHAAAARGARAAAWSEAAEALEKLRNLEAERVPRQG